jgi:uncharacterized membrane protein YkoI
MAPPIVRWATILLLTGLLFSPAANAREETVSLDAVPAPVMSAVKARFPGASVKGAGKETEKGQLVYEITLDEKGRNVDVTVTPGGDLLLIEKAIDKAELPAPVAQALSKAYPGATYRVVEEIVEVEKGREHLKFYEVELATADRHSKEIKVKPDGGGMTEEKEEEEEGDEE